MTVNTRDDAPHVPGAIGSIALTVRRDTEATGVSADGDYSPLASDALGNLRTRRLAGEDAAVDATAAGLFGDYYQTTVDTLVFNGPCIVLGYIVTVATAAGSINLTDASAAGGTARHVIAAGAAAGTVVNFPPMRFNTGCYVDYLAGPATGTIQWIVRGA